MGSVARKKRDSYLTKQKKIQPQQIVVGVPGGTENDTKYSKKAF